MNVLALLHHPNIVSLIGVGLKSDPMFMCVEYVKNGDLHQYLIENGDKMRYEKFSFKFTNFAS